VAYRLHSKLLLRPSLFARLCAVPVMMLVAGCQSNVQHDLIAREMRMQEDQIYAMEDYLAQYQQLICKYRAENAALRRQLAEVEDTDATLPTRPSPPARNGTPPAIKGPEIEVPATPPANGTRPQPQIDVPEVPPLEETTSSDTELEFEHQAITPVAALEETAQERVIRDVWLHGEVVDNDAGGGPRLVVDVEPLDSNGRPVPFAGTLSLMLLALNEDGGQQSLARWDFSSDEVQSAVDVASASHLIRFHLELPPEKPIAESTEIWARLLPQGGNKLLANAAIDLHEPGHFSSLPDVPVPREPAEERPVVAALYGETPTTPPAVSAELNDAGWSIARPGEPANLEHEADDADEQWRPSSEPIPTVIARPVPVRPKQRLSQTATRPKTPPKTVEAEVRPPAGWSPDRPAGAAADASRMANTPMRPSWSATR
jgi:hypothetical protein